MPWGLGIHPLWIGQQGALHREGAGGRLDVERSFHLALQESQKACAMDTTANTASAGLPG